MHDLLQQVFHLFQAPSYAWSLRFLSKSTQMVFFFFPNFVLSLLSFWSFCLENGRLSDYILYLFIFLPRATTGLATWHNFCVFFQQNRRMWHDVFEATWFFLPPRWLVPYLPAAPRRQGAWAPRWVPRWYWAVALHYCTLVKILQPLLT